MHAATVNEFFSTVSICVRCAERRHVSTPRRRDSRCSQHYLPASHEHDPERGMECRTVGHNFECLDGGLEAHIPVGPYLSNPTGSSLPGAGCPEVLEGLGLLQNTGGETQGIPNAWQLTSSGEEILGMARPEGGGPRSRPGGEGDEG